MHTNNALEFLRSERVEVVSYQPLIDLRLVVIDTEADLMKLQRRLQGVLPSIRKISRHPGRESSPYNFMEERKVPRTPVGLFD